MASMRASAGDQIGAQGDTDFKGRIGESNRQLSEWFWRCVATATGLDKLSKKDHILS